MISIPSLTPQRWVWKMW